MASLVIVDIYKQNNADATMFKMSDNQIYDYNTVIEMVEKGQVRNVEVRRSEDGSKHLYYDPDTLTANDLYNVPKNLYDSPTPD